MSRLITISGWAKLPLAMHDRTTSAATLSDAERLNRLRLIRSDNVGPRGIMAQTPQGLSATEKSRPDRAGRDLVLLAHQPHVATGKTAAPP
ncbi:hypothetical protein [Bradyrhizobium tropiciagri]|uniref:hypothetical protein n=1 Tax=Bradyrhizobium tropiciagri TaxID=312253 RepID=UPI0032E04468